MAKFVVGSRADDIYEALHEAGVLHEPPSSVARVVIDLRAGEPAMIYIDTFADSLITEVVREGHVVLVQRQRTEQEAREAQRARRERERGGAV